MYCVEPNDDMRSVAERELCRFTNFRSIRGNAENTTLEAGFVDYITTAQAFHWFDGKKFRQECSRIKEFFDGRYEYMAFDNPLYFDKERFIARSLSGSYSLKEGDKHYAEYIESLISVFDKHAKNGCVSSANQSVVYIGGIK